MSKQDTHKYVDTMYDLLLTMLALATIFVVPDVKVTVALFSILWIWKDRFESVIESVINKRLGVKDDETIK